MERTPPNGIVSATPPATVKPVSNTPEPAVPAAAPPLVALPTSKTKCNASILFFIRRTEINRGKTMRGLQDVNVNGKWYAHGGVGIYRGGMPCQFELAQ